MDAVIHFVTRRGYCICPRPSLSCTRSDTIRPDTVLEREEWMRQGSSSLLSSHDGPPRLFCRVRLQLLSRLRRGGIRSTVFRVLGTRALAPSSYVSPGFSASLSVFFIARLCSPNALTRGSWARASLPWSLRLCLFHPPAPRGSANLKIYPIGHDARREPSSLPEASSTASGEGRARSESDDLGCAFRGRWSRIVLCPWYHGLGSILGTSSLHSFSLCVFIARRCGPTPRLLPQHRLLPPPSAAASSPVPTRHSMARVTSSPFS
jgi:hypothetical protein